MNPTPKNHFKLSEWSGAVGDLGTTLPLAFALIVYNGFSPERIFFLWGIAYILSGWYYKVPVAIQPLKAMAVIAIATGYSASALSTTAVFYGILLILLSTTGVIRWLGNWFTPAIVRGIQLGVGLILAQKAIQLTVENGFFLKSSLTSSLMLNAIIFATLIILLWWVQFRRRFPIILLIIPTGILIAILFNVHLDLSTLHGSLTEPQTPQWNFFLNSLIFLMIPQLPLTLGNAVFAACDACHAFWKEQAQRVTTTKLGFSIGLINIFIGLLGGFPICHGAGGIGAHAQFGGKTGGTTIILGTFFVLVALSPFSTFLFFIPVPVLGAMLLLDSYRLMTLLNKLELKYDLLVAILVGSVSFFTRNLTIALLLGFGLQLGQYLYGKWYLQTSSEL
ncbi:MAG: hypothetical protein D6675_08650 [Gemmatimonadetes bacterium]|nr:MAG: hypothetical protein D6675_08650 [Gemmatimonadota bacterium]